MGHFLFYKDIFHSLAQATESNSLNDSQSECEWQLNINLSHKYTVKRRFPTSIAQGEKRCSYWQERTNKLETSMHGH